MHPQKLLAPPPHPTPLDAYGASFRLTGILNTPLAYTICLLKEHDEDECVNGRTHGGCQCSGSLRQCTRLLRLHHCFDVPNWKGRVRWR